MRRKKCSIPLSKEHCRVNVPIYMSYVAWGRAVLIKNSGVLAVLIQISSAATMVRIFGQGPNFGLLAGIGPIFGPNFTQKSSFSSTLSKQHLSKVHTLVPIDPM